MAEPLVTIVTPSFNQGRFIRATIESVLSQDYPNVEYIIVDGGSKDETAKVAADYASRLNWISEPDRGQSHAINKGFRMARGSILFWINSDDLILPGAVRHAVEGLRANPHAGAVYGEGYLIDEKGRTTRRFPCTEPFNLRKLMYVSDYILQQTAYFRRSAIEQAGYLREDLHFAMDWDLLIRIGKRCPIAYIPEYMGCLREYPTAKSFSGGEVRAREIANLLREHTGMRYPPGAIVYGLETYWRIWSAEVEAWTPRVVARPLQHLLQRVCAYTIDRSIRAAQGWHDDRWAEALVRYMVPAGAGRILVLRGWMPASKEGNQQLTILSEGERLAEREFFGGDFEWRVPLPDTENALGLKIRARHSFIPALDGRSRDTRRLAYHLRSVGIEQRGSAAGKWRIAVNGVH